VKAVTALQDADAIWSKLLASYRSASERRNDSAFLPDVEACLPPFTWLTRQDKNAIESSLSVERERALWWIIGCMEVSSEHPLASELVNVAASASRRIFEPAYDFEITMGVGVQGKVGEALFFVGSASHVLQLDVSNSTSTASLQEWIIDARKDGSTVVAVAVDGVPLAAIALGDVLTPHAKTCIQQLQSSGVEVWMCTGDHRESACKVGEACNIDAQRIVAEALPARKVDLVRRLQEGKTQGKRNIVAMVGDGINDAPALAAADVGIAIGVGHM